jgi:hypothetical protein
MKNNNTDTSDLDLFVQFLDRETVCKDELLEFYRSGDPELTERAFRRILYSLEKQGIVLPLGAGVYALSKPSALNSRSIFAPHLSSTIQELGLFLNEQFPYTQYAIWETSTLHEFMIHQPGSGQIILEVEKSACESVFNRLKEQPSVNAFLEPDKVTIERYISSSPESILVLKLITQSPKVKKNGILFARLEKILVDIFADRDRFFTFHGQELINIFENAFSMYWINTKTIFRYAGRRKATLRLEEFINTRTKIELSAYTGETR